MMLITPHRNTERGQRTAAAAPVEVSEQQLHEAINILQQSGHAVRVAQDILQDAALRRALPYRPTLERIMSRLCVVFELTPADIRSPSRALHLAFARQAVCYWAMRQTRLSSPRIGHLLGQRNHTTVLSAVSSYQRKRAQMGRKLRLIRRAEK